MGRRQKKYPVDHDRFYAALRKRGIDGKELSRIYGRTRNYFGQMIASGGIPEALRNSLADHPLEKYRIPYSEYCPLKNEEQVETETTNQSGTSITVEQLKTILSDYKKELATAFKLAQKEAMSETFDLLVDTGEIQREIEKALFSESTQRAIRCAVQSGYIGAMRSVDKSDSK